MKRNRMIAVLLTLALLCMPNSVLAYTIEQPVSADRKIVIEGNIGEAKENVPVTLLVLKKDKTAADLKEALQDQEDLYHAIFSVICYMDEVKSDSEGNFCFRFIIDETCTSGDYVALIGGAPFLSSSEGSIAGTVERRIVYIPIQEKVKAIKALNASVSGDSSADFQTVLQTYTREFSLFSDDTALQTMYESLQEKGKLFERIKEKGLYEEKEETINDSLSAFRKNMTEAVLFQSIEEQEDAEVLEQMVTAYAGSLGLRLDGINAENKAHVYGKIAELTQITSAETIQACIDEAVVLYQMNHAKKWGDVKKIITAQQKYLGVDLKKSGTDYDAVYHVLFEERATFQSVRQLVERFEKLLPLHPVVKPTSRPTGGGGGGGLPALPASSVAPTPTPQPTTSPTPSEPQEIRFDDVSEDYWASKVICSVAKQGLMKGNEKGQFLPEAQITREEFVTILLRAMGQEPEAKASKFTDVNESDWFSGYVEKARELGLAKGYTDGSFGAGQQITRQDMTVLLLKAMEIMEKKLPELADQQNFTDDSQIADYAKESVRTLQKAKIVNGMEDGSFAPERFATRAEAAQMLFSVLSLIQ